MKNDDNSPTLGDASMALLGMKVCLNDIGLQIDAMAISGEYGGCQLTPEEQNDALHASEHMADVLAYLEAIQISVKNRA